MSPSGEYLRYIVRLCFQVSNNVAEYEALMKGLRIAVELSVQRLDARGGLSACRRISNEEVGVLRPQDGSVLSGGTTIRILV